eukprot:CAMPEP_0172212844 /NCGR_PEP_ID=MMETSP1050-20130122/37261_1 /TAXON_ID=233186 /ORGANISM="Cryptomonas curvata, Strain CCAP979/52" /LENGTH=114 /DNA_ID=CAMNT_0012893607 /DNA_START=36 /DNA_END=380 /DNA_ORIENTATION=-
MPSSGAFPGSMHGESWFARPSTASPSVCACHTTQHHPDPNHPVAQVVTAADRLASEPKPASTAARTPPVSLRRAAKVAGARRRAASTPRRAGGSRSPPRGSALRSGGGPGPGRC